MKNIEGLNNTRLIIKAYNEISLQALVEKSLQMIGLKVAHVEQISTEYLAQL